tara:strand:- start:1403 stop:2008 length:606 start_codon:yes stop_codon:yes gene_type:complete
LLKFNILEGIAAPLPMINIDTDMIIPKQFLKTIKRSGLGKNLFHELRYDLNGNIRNNFVLNWDPFKKSSILVTGQNFGCGSSREHAPWSLLDFGIRSIISTSFADIFFNNCFKNGILPIILSQNICNELMELANQKKIFKIDLPNQLIMVENDKIASFQIDEFRKKCLIEGLDDISLTLKNLSKIETFEENMKNLKPWISK